MNLKSLYSKFIVSICESDYSKADTILEQILTEKVKKKVERVAKEKCCGKPKCSHKKGLKG